MKNPNLENNNNDELINISNLVNDELTKNLKPSSNLEEEKCSWEEKLIMNLNSIKKGERK